MAKGILLLLVIMFGAMWLILRPGILIAQPSPSLPDGMTLIYLDKPAGVKVFNSTDSQCVAIYGTASGSCRDQVLADSQLFFQNELVQLPYMSWLADLLQVNP
jgi:hypothetical protein